MSDQRLAQDFPGPYLDPYSGTHGHRRGRLAGLLLSERRFRPVDEAFDADLIDYLFSSGAVEIYGQVTNSLPLNFDMNLIVTDAADVPVGIAFSPQKVEGGGQGTDGAVSDVSFTITEADMPKMKNARNLRIRLDAYCDEALAGRHLRPDQQAKLALKLRKSGGITISTDE